MRVPQWIIDLEAPVDVTALLRDNEDTETALVQAQLATQVLQGSPAISQCRIVAADAADVEAMTADDAASAEEPPLRDSRPSFEQLMARVQAYGIVPERYQAYADRRWGRAGRSTERPRPGLE